MEDFISRSANAFSQFLSENEAILKNSKSTNLIISYALPFDKFETTGKLMKLLNISERSFYFEDPESDFLIIANDEILNISENGDGRFAATDKKIREWKNKILSNHDIIKNKRVPLFIGAMKFMVEHSDNDWKDFNDSAWYIPKTILLKIKSHQFLIFNFLYSPKTSLDQLTKNFQSRLEQFNKVKR